MTKSRQKPKRPFFQFSLLTLLVLMFVASISIVIYRDYVLNRPDLEVRKLVDGFVIRFQVNDADRDDEPTTDNSGFFVPPSPFGSTGTQTLSDLHGPYIASDKYDRVFARGQYRDGKSVGSWTIYHPSGRVALRGTSHDFVRHGRWTAWHESGWKAAEVRHGKPREKFTRYFPSGEAVEGSIEALLGERQLLTNRDGIAKTYWPNGQIRSEGRFENNEREGNWRFTSDTGKLVAAGNCRRGVRHGEWQQLDATGELCNVIYIDGHPINDVEKLLVDLEHDLDSPNSVVSHRAYATLGSLGEHGVALLSKRITKGELRHVTPAIQQLALLGPAAKDALSSIQALTNHRDSLVRAHAIVATHRIDESQHDRRFKQLAEEIARASGRRQRQILSTTASLGLSLVPRVEKLLQSKNRTDRLVGLNILNAMILAGQFQALKFDPKSQEMIFELLKKTASSHADPQTARLARFVLENLESSVIQPQPIVHGTFIPVVG